MLERGIVSAFRLPVSEREVSCTLLTGRGSVSAKLKTEPAVYDSVGGGEQGGGKQAYAKLMKSMVKGAELRKRAKNVLAGCREQYGGPAAPMLGDIARAADRIMRAFISGAPMMVRFHGDGDGVAGAIALYRALNGIVASGLSQERQVSWQVNRDVAYTKEAFYSDRLLFSSFRSAERPMLVIIDFGTHIDSNDAIAMAEETCNVVWIDHHTLPEKFDPGRRSLYINPFNYGSDSRLSAGLIGSLIAQTIGADCADLMEAALISDHSACADYENRQARKAALVLDYMITRRDPDSSSMRKIDSVISDRARLDDAYSRVGAMLDRAIAVGGKAARRYRTADGVDVYVVDFKKVRDGDYPPPGRFSSEMQYHLETSTGKPAITVVYYGNYISVRVSKPISGRVGLIGIIGKMGEETAGEVAGGGHMEAASIKAGSHGTPEVLRMLLRSLNAV